MSSSNLYGFVAGALAVIAVICLAGVIWLASRSSTVPDVLVATAGAAVGSLGTLLARGGSPTPPGGR